MYDDVLIATDGSDGAKRATRHAVALADRLDAQLHVLSVAEDGPHGSEKGDEMRTDHEGQAESAVEEAVKLAETEGLEATSTVRHGVPQDEIVEFADHNGMDMVVVGAVARSGLDKLVVGSVAEEVVRNAPVPVVTVRDRS